MGDTRDDKVKSEQPDGEQLEQRLVTHLLTVLSVSAGMVGVCLTAIGLVGILTRQQALETFIDELLVANAFLYLISALLSFLALRSPLRQRADTIAFAVDVVFCIGLTLTVVACALLVWVML